MLLKENYNRRSIKVRSVTACVYGKVGFKATLKFTFRGYLKQQFGILSLLLSLKKIFHRIFGLFSVGLKDHKRSREE